LRVLKTKQFARFARRERIADASLIEAVRCKTRAVFLFGFAKNERDNIKDDELATLRDIARGWLEADDGALVGAMANGVISEVMYEEDPKN
jgi:hypothetical protein